MVQGMYIKYVGGGEGGVGGGGVYKFFKKNFVAPKYFIAQ